MRNQPQNTIEISGYQFYWPVVNSGFLADEAGVYVVLDSRDDGQQYVIDVGESSEIRSRIENHDRKFCWRRNSTGTVGVAALYTGTWTVAQRRQLEGMIRDKYNPSCGQR